MQECRQRGIAKAKQSRGKSASASERQRGRTVHFEVIEARPGAERENVETLGDKAKPIAGMTFGQYWAAER